MEASTPEKRERGSRFQIIGSVLLIFASAGGIALGLTFRKPFVPLKGLEPALDRLDFGEVWEDPQFRWALPITNHSAQDVEIKRFLGSCNCSQIEPKTLIVPAGQTREVQLTIDLSPKEQGDIGSPVHDFEVGISPEVSGVTSPVWWPIRGRVRSAIQCAPPFVDFGRIPESSRYASQKTRITALVPLAKLSANSTSPAFDVHIQPSAPETRDSFELVVTQRSMLPRGEIRCLISVTPELSNGQCLAAKKVEVRGRIVSDIEPSPSTLLFGACGLNTTATDTIRLRSSSRQPFTVKEVRCEGAGLKAERVADAGGSSAAFEVERRIVTPGEKNGKLVFRVARSDKQEEEVVVRVSYCGVKSSTD